MTMAATSSSRSTVVSSSGGSFRYVTSMLDTGSSTIVRIWSPLATGGSSSTPVTVTSTPEAQLTASSITLAVLSVTLSGGLASTARKTAPIGRVRKLTRNVADVTSLRTKPPPTSMTNPGSYVVSLSV